MNTALWVEGFWPFAVAALVVFISGLYCLTVSRNLVRMLVAMELLTKSATLLLVLAGAVTGRMAQMQSLILTLIVLEVVAITVAAGIVIGAFRKNGSIDARSLARLKG